MQLFLLPFAGGSAASFKNVVELLDERIDVITVEYPGRGTRSSEAFIEDFESLKDDVVDCIQNRRNENLPFAVLGYSMGSIMAYEIVADERIKGELKHIFLCAENSPMDKRDSHLNQNATDEVVISRLKELGGINERLLHNKRFFDIYMRPSIVDFKMFKQHECAVRDTKLACSATVIYSEADTPFDTVKRWAELVDEKTDFYEMGYNHFFINQYYTRIAEIINNQLKRYL